MLATSYMSSEATKAVDELTQRGIDVELIDLRSIKPWDRNLVYSSVGKTGRLVIADAAWMSGGVAAEIAASVAGEMFHALKAPIGRVCLPDAPAPSSAVLEHAYYIGADDIVSAVEKSTCVEYQIVVMAYHVPFIDPRSHYAKLKPEIDRAIIDCLANGDLVNRHQLKDFLEQHLAEFVGVKYAVGVNSGTMRPVCIAWRRSWAGHEVITVAHTFVATVSAIVHCGRSRC